jgi:hypothetical protein
MPLLKRIAALRSKLADVASGLALAQKRVAHYKARAKNAENPKHPHPALLERADRRLHYWREKERRAYLRRHHLKVALERKLKQLAKQGPQVERVNGKLRVVGGTVNERLAFSSPYAIKHWHDYYSEPGIYEEDHALDNADPEGKRRDCAEYLYEDRRVCGIKTKTTEPRYTGSIVDEGREVSQRYAETHIGVAVIFGSDSGFHAAKTTGHGPYCWQHGTPELSVGRFDEFGSGTQVRYFVLDR